jgi:hypothetical protein
MYFTELEDIYSIALGGRGNTVKKTKNLAFRSYGFRVHSSKFQRSLLSPNYYFNRPFVKLPVLLWRSTPLHFSRSLHCHILRKQQEQFKGTQE